ncbi:restriction endonuclease subunit S, partial [Pseudoalteromonas nigrifaciens]
YNSWPSNLRNCTYYPNLGDYKKGVIQQIFSQQIRFKDDDGKAFPEWQVKTIGDVMTESRIKGSSGDVAKKLTVKIWGKGVIPKKDDSKGSENTQYYKRKAGQFIYGKLDFLNCAFAIIPDELDGYESTLDLPSLDVSSLVNKFFVLEVVKQKRFYKRFGEIADGSRKAKRINVGVFQEMPITLPSKAEQNKIMAFLDSLDKKTNAVNEQIEQTKLFKKGLLQQMFV